MALVSLRNYTNRTGVVFDSGKLDTLFAEDLVEIKKALQDGTASIKTEAVETLGPLTINNINTETLAADKVVVAGDPMIQFLDPGGAARNVDLPDGAAAGTIFIIVNTADAAETITVRNGDATPLTIDTLAQNESGFFISNGTSWTTLIGSSAKAAV